jgi:hypothetical protein
MRNLNKFNTKNIEPVNDNKNTIIVVVKLKIGSLKMFFIFKRASGGFAPSNGTKDSEGGIITGR